MSMTRREWLQRVLGATVAAAVAPLVDLTDMTPAFWQQPALRDVLPWRITMPDGLRCTFDAEVISETVLADGTVQFSLRPRGPMTLDREFQQSEELVLPGDGVHEPGRMETFEPVPGPDPHATIISRNGVPVGELTDIGVPELKRADFDAFSGGDTDGYLGGLRRSGEVSFTVEFK